MGSKMFPLRFKSHSTISGGKDRSYVIGAMFTAGYAEKAKRFAASCERFGLPYVMHEVPTVHCSISGLGSDDPSYTKPNFIRHLLATYNKPVLYVDADCEFISQPDLIDQLARSRCDFAVYNAYADEFTDRFLPIALSLRPNEPPVSNRFYRFAGRVNWASNSQLGCFGCVQFYRNSLAARTLLSRWHRTILAFPGSGDDAHLNFTFNNLRRRSWLSWFLNVYWLPQSYARYSWWIFTKPTINHPDHPGIHSNFKEIEDLKGRKDVYRNLMERTNADLLIPRDCIIDTNQGMLCKLVDGQVVPIDPLDRPVWI